MEILPIAHFESPLKSKFGIPRQSGLVEELTGRIVFERAFRQMEAVRGLEDFDYLWLIWEFSANGSGKRKENSALPLATEGTQESGMRKEICNEAKRIKVVCVNLLSDGSEERFEFDAHRSSASFHSFTFSPFHFLYEPNASVMKAGCFDLLAERFGVQPLHQNSHLFVSDKEVTDFPGRGFDIERTTSMNKRELKESLAGVTQANIAVRNFPQSVADLRKRLKLQDGGDTYIFATTVENMGHRLLICRKIS